MTTIKDLEERLKAAEAALNALKADLADLKQQQEPEPESLFGRWATNPDYGPVIITSDHPDNGKVCIHARWDKSLDGSTHAYVNLSDLALDPQTLTTPKDFRDAPVGTIVEDHNGDVYVGDSIGWHTYDGEYDSKEMASIGTSRVIRWGTGK